LSQLLCVHAVRPCICMHVRVYVCVCAHISGGLPAVHNWPEYVK